MKNNLNQQPIAFFLPNLWGGGAERVTVNLLKGMAELNIPLDLVLASAEGPFINQVPKQVRIINLAAGRVFKATLPLSNYLQKNKPLALVSHLSHANVIAAIAKKLSRTDTKLVLVEHTTLSVHQSKLIRAKFIPPLMKWLFPNADSVVTVSEYSARDLENQLGLNQGFVKTIYNPIVNSELISKAKAPVNHPWLNEENEESVPVFLSVGRLTKAKDFFTLIKAFSILRKQIKARLLIFGEGEDRLELEGLIQELGITEDVSMPGFTENPYAYMSKVNAFVLSSRWECLPTVLVEAMACGCPVLSTDCICGPKEILAEGKYGVLIPVENPEAMSKAMLNILKSPVNHQMLAQRAQDFSFDKSVSNYLSLLNNM